MKIETFPRIKSRWHFERNVFFLVDALRHQRLMIAQGVNVDGLLAVRRLPNGRIDLLSIDESTRLQANMAANAPTDLVGTTEPSDGEE